MSLSRHKPLLCPTLLCSGSTCTSLSQLSCHPICFGNTEAHPASKYRPWKMMKITNIVSFCKNMIWMPFGLQTVYECASKSLKGDPWFKRKKACWRFQQNWMNAFLFILFFVASLSIFRFSLFSWQYSLLRFGQRTDFICWFRKSQLRYFPFHSATPVIFTYHTGLVQHFPSENLEFWGLQ